MSLILLVTLLTSLQVYCLLFMLHVFYVMFGTMIGIIFEFRLRVIIGLILGCVEVGIEFGGLLCRLSLMLESVILARNGIYHDCL